MYPNALGKIKNGIGTFFIYEILALIKRKYNESLTESYELFNL